VTWKFIAGAGLALFVGLIVGELLVELALKLGRRGPGRF
jgi:hypothetical protein